MFSHLHNATNARRGFTLVELMVVLVIISILSSLMLAGLAGVRQRAKVEKTKSTIRKLHEIVMPQYESYQTRRVALPSGLATRTAIASERLIRLRTLALYEMPDSWIDTAPSATSSILISSTTIPGPVAGAINSGTIPPYAFTSAPKGYGAFRNAIENVTPGKLSHTYRSSECLYQIMTRGQSDASAMEQFRSDEIGDADSDTAPEFIDGWGNPIAFIRWPVGFPSNVQIASATLSHDSWDPMQVDALAFTLIPLIYSAGVDGQYGLIQLDSWSGQSMLGIFSATNQQSPAQKPGEPDNSAPFDHRDNITNHDLMSKR